MIIVKPVKTKRQIRQELDQAVSSYLKKGGNIENVPRGTSGIEGDQNLFAMNSEGHKTRTPLNDVVNTLEARKNCTQKTEQTSSGNKRRKVLVKDDFGEPLRWVWVEGSEIKN